MLTRVERPVVENLLAAILVRQEEELSTAVLVEERVVEYQQGMLVGQVDQEEEPFRLLAELVERAERAELLPPLVRAVHRLSLLLTVE